jgi:hypothetical protein
MFQRKVSFPLNGPRGQFSAEKQQLFKFEIKISAHIVCEGKKNRSFKFYTVTSVI